MNLRFRYHLSRMPFLRNVLPIPAPRAGRPSESYAYILDDFSTQSIDPWLN